MCALAVLLALVMLGGKGPFAEAKGGTGLAPSVVAIDMNTLNNSQSTVGNIDRCWPATVGTPFDFDVVLDDIPIGHDLSSQDYTVDFNCSKLALGAPSMNHGAALSLLCRRTCPGGLFDGSTATCVPPAGSFHSVVMDMTVPAGPVAEQPKDRGVLGRYTLIPQAAGAGRLTFITIRDEKDTPAGDLILGDSGGLDWFDTAANPTHEVWDAQFNPVHGIVAIAPATCPPDTDVKILSFGPLDPDLSVPVSEQDTEEFVKIIHNNGAAAADVLVTKEVDIPNNSDTVNFPACEASNVCQGELITVKAGVQWGWKATAGAPCVLDPASPGPDKDVLCAPAKGAFCAKAVQDMDNEFAVSGLIEDVVPTVDVLLHEMFDVHCYEASFHDYLFQNYIEPFYPWDPDAPYYNDGEPVADDTNLAGDPEYTNNSKSYLKHIGFTAEADLKIVSQTLAPTTGMTWLDMDQDGTPDPPYIQAGTTASVDVSKVLHNNGPYEPVDADLTKMAMAMRVPIPDAAGSELYVGGCGAYPYLGNGVDNDGDTRVDDGCMLACGTSITPAADQELAIPMNGDVPHTGEVATINCSKAAVGIEADDDGDTAIDEDRWGGPGADNDNDGKVDEDPCNDLLGTLTDQALPAADCSCDLSTDLVCEYDLTGTLASSVLGAGTFTADTDTDWSGYTTAHPCGTLTGTAILTFASGTVTLSLDDPPSEECESTGPTSHTVTLRGTITVGTGAFLGASGKVYVSGTADQTAGDTTPGDGCDDAYDIAGSFKGLSGFDLDGDTLIDEDDPYGDDDCDGKIDEDSPFLPVVLAVSNTISPKDPHVVDKVSTNNSNTASFVFIVARDLTPTWSVTIDDANANVLSVPVDDDCLTNEPCKKMFSMAIPTNQPFVGQITYTPADFTECNGVLGCNFLNPADDPVNGQTAGKIIFHAHADLTTHSTTHLCTDYVGGQAVLYEAALPSWAPPGFEGPDVWNQLTAINAWPLELERDSLMRGVIAMGAQPWLRRVGMITALGMQVNNVVFYTGGPWISVTVLGDPLHPSALNTCPEMAADTIMLGAAVENVNVVYEKCVVPSTGLNDKVFMNDMYREDNPTFIITNYDTGTCTAPASDITVGLCKDEDIGDTHNAQCSVPLVDKLIPASLPVSFPVEITVNPGTATQPVAVSLSIVSHDPCTAEWVGQTGDTQYPLSEVGSTNLDRLDFTTPSIGPGNHIYTRSYSIHCTAPGTYPQNVQISASVTTGNPTPIGDPDESNNTAENRVDVTVRNIPDYDGDTILNGVDNCPWVSNPDQLNTDGDSMGNACDPDDDNDGILDDGADGIPGNADDDKCPTAPEGGDGNPTDGCPGSDVTGLVVTYSDPEPVTVDVSENHDVESVTATAQNGSHVADIDFTLLLVSDVSVAGNKCEARWVCLTGDNCVNDIIDGTLFSQLEVTKKNVAPQAYASVTRYYTVHCNAPSDHFVKLEVSAVPAPPVIDPNVQNGNVFKDLSLDIVATALADLKKVGIALLADDCSSAPPTTMAPNTDVSVCVWYTLHNNGPYGPVLATDTLTATAPPDCTVDGNPVKTTVDHPSLATSVDFNMYHHFNIRCTKPSDHTFTFADTVSTTQLHVRDNDASNNSKSATLPVAVIDQNAAVSVAVNVAAPTSMWVSEDEIFPVTKTFTYSGIAGTSVEPDVDQVMRPTGDNAAECQVSFHVTNALLAKVRDLVITKDGVVVNPPTPYGWEASDSVWGEFGGSVDVHYQIPLAVGQTVVVEEWDKHCTRPSYHDFSLITDVTRNPANDPHIIFPDTDNGQGWWESVWAEADLGIVDWFFMDIPLIDNNGDTSPDTPLVKVAPSSWRYGHEKEVIHNNGPYSPVDVTTDVTAQAHGSCAVSYNVMGSESEILVDGVDKTQSPPGTDLKSANGGSISVQLFAEDLEVSVDLWQALLWNFHIADQGQCDVWFTKEITGGPPPHIIEPEGGKPNIAHKGVIVCADTDGDTVADNCGAVNEHDNCKHVKNADQKNSDGDLLGDACDPEPKHDVGTKSCLVFGPAPVNLSLTDTTGRYMWVICEVGNFSGHTEKVSIDLTVEAPPTGCTSSESLILPGFDNFWMSTAEQKWVLYRVKYVCTSATPGVYPLDISMCIKHDTVHTGGGTELGLFLQNNCWNGVRNLIVHSQP
jgi:hypothetical protein